MRIRGLTLVEVLTIVVALVVVAAVVIPLWHSRDLRLRRAEAMDMLQDIQKAQDEYFGRHARYADLATLTAAPPDGLGLPPRSRKGHFAIELQSGEDGLSYVAVARAVLDPARKPDTRCAELRINHQGRRSATNDQGGDTSRDCWNRH